jgi:phosphoglycerate kinase
MRKKTVRDLEGLDGVRVLVRVDFNVPMKNGAPLDDTRIRATLPTLEYLLSKRARIVLASHLGRPKARVAPEFSLKPVSERLSALMGQPVQMAGDCIGSEVQGKAAALAPGSLLLLENVRFHPQEERNEPAFASRLVTDTGSSVFVNDAFGCAHRAHASTEGVSHHVRESVAGLLMERELHYLGLALEAPERPFVAVLGGAKVSDKIAVIESLLKRVDTLLIGGGMAYTFLRADGHETGGSLVEDDRLSLAGDLLNRFRDRIRLPLDHVAAAAFDPNAERKVVQEVPPGWIGLDIGPQTAEAYAREIQGAKLIFWNGPMGVFELEPFARGTLAMAKALSQAEGTTIVGGGDSVAAVVQMGLASAIDHVSTGGGASLEFLAGGSLPGVDCLANAS